MGKKSLSYHPQTGSPQACNTEEGSQFLLKGLPSPRFILGDGYPKLCHLHRWSTTSACLRKPLQVAVRGSETQRRPLRLTATTPRPAPLEPQTVPLAAGTELIEAQAPGRRLGPASPNIFPFTLRLRRGPGREGRLSHLAPPMARHRWERRLTQK